MFSTATIIDTLKKDENIDYKKLCKFLKITKKSDKTRLDIALNALEKLEIITKKSNNEIISIIDQTHIKAKIRCSSKGFCFAVRDNSSEDIYIKENLLNNAWNGDKVLVRVIKEGIRRRSPEGVVDCILERTSKFLLAKVQIIDEKIYGIPIDDRILSKIRLSDKDKKYLYSHIKKNIVKIEIDLYPIAQEEGEGHVINELNLNDNEDVDNDFVLSKNGMHLKNTNFDLEINEIEIQDRLDLTSTNSYMFKSWKYNNSPLLPIFQIEKIKDGQIKLWIHSNSIPERIDFSSKNISDYFNNNLESVPLSGKWNNFLTSNLLEKSDFKIGEKNDAISLCLTLSKNKEIIDWKFHLTKVKCSAILNNNHLEELISNKTKKRITSKILKPLKEKIDDILEIMEISQKFRNDQIEKGKYEISRGENNIESINDLLTHRPSEYSNEYLDPINNKDIQTYISPILYEADSIWFKHSTNIKIKNAAYYFQDLNYINVNEIIKQSQLLDVNFELDDKGSLTLKKLLSSCNDLNKKRIINKYLINSLKNNNAKPNNKLDDSLDNSGFALAPWSLPSLDYINFINQYNIYNMIKNAKRSNKNNSIVDICKKDSWIDINWDLFTKNNLKISQILFDDLMIDKFNEFRLKSKIFNTNMINIKKIREAEKLIGKVYTGLITTVQSYGFFVELPSLLIEGLVHVSTLNDDWYEYRSRQGLLVGRKSKNTYRVGDLIDIKILKVDLLKYQIDLEIVENK